MRQWKEIEKAEVAELLARKLTAGQIACKFAGRSRSAIIGLVNREPMLRSVGFRHHQGSYAARAWKHRLLDRSPQPGDGTNS